MASGYSFAPFTPLQPNLNKILADRRANVQAARIVERVREEVKRVFAPFQGINPIPFPEKSSDIPNRHVLTLIYLSPDRSIREDSTLQHVETIIRESGSSDRTFKSALIFAIAENDYQLQEDARKVLAWEDIRDQESERLDDTQKRQLSESLNKAKRDLQETVWRTYKYIALLGKDNTVRTIDLGLITSSSSTSIVKLIIEQLRRDGDAEDIISPRFLVRNWPPAFQEWSTKSVRDAFFASPQFPRLLNADTVKQTIAQGVCNGAIAYVGQTVNGRYDPFLFNQSLSANDIELSDDTFIITAEVAQAYQQRITDPPRLAALAISPQLVRLEVGTKQAFLATGIDQYGHPITVNTALVDKGMNQAGTGTSQNLR